ncbi:MAG: tRNA pseudouridine(55) synthase TruB [Trueperaceae bacterium]
MPVFIVDKPLNATSHDVVAEARRLLRTRKVGHGGTLDPLASGVLALLVGDDTKLSPFLTGSRKRYLAWVSFGATTVTLDAEGPIIEGDRDAQLSAGLIEAALPAFLALHEQVPPQYSAIKRAGVKGYEAARKGERLDLPPRPAGYFEATLLAFAPQRDALPSRIEQTAGVWEPSDSRSESGRDVPLPDPLGNYPSALLRMEVEAGTYIRSFARDLGEALGCGAFLSGLVRTGAGTLDLTQAVTLSQLPQSASLSAAQVLPYPRVELNPIDAERIRKGQRLPLPLAERTTFLDQQGDLVAVAEDEEGRMKLLRVWSKG